MCIKYTSLRHDWIYKNDKYKSTEFGASKHGQELVLTY